MPLLLPPPAGGEGWGALLNVAGKGEGGPADFREGPAALDPHVHVDPPIAGRLRPADEAGVGERLAHDERHAPDVVPGDARYGVEVDPQLVGVVQVVGPYRVRVEVEAAEVGHPGQAGRVVDHDLVGRPARGEGELDRAEPVRPLLRGPLLEEEVAAGAVRVALEGHRPAASAAQRAVGDRDVVAHDLKLRDRAAGSIREVDFVRVGDGHLAAGDGEDLGTGRHVPRIRGRVERARDSSVDT